MPHESAKAHSISLAFCVGSQRRLTVAPDRDEDPSFGGNAHRGIRVVQSGEQRASCAIAVAALDPKGPLTGGGERQVRREKLRRAPFEAESEKAGARQDDRVAFSGVDFPQAGVDVASQRDHHDIRTAGQKRKRTAQTRRAHARPCRQGLERPMPRSDENVARVFAFGYARDDEAWRQCARNILDRMHREVRALFEERLFDLFDEEAFATDIGQRPVLDTVSARDDLQLVKIDRRVYSAQIQNERAALGESQRGAPGRVST